MLIESGGGRSRVRDGAGHQVVGVRGVALQIRRRSGKRAEGSRNGERRERTEYGPDWSLRKRRVSPMTRWNHCAVGAAVLPSEVSLLAPHKVLCTVYMLHTTRTIANTAIYYRNNSMRGSLRC